MSADSTARLISRQNIATSEEMHDLGLKLGSVLAAGDIVVLTGPLGAGKTTLTRGVGEALGTIGTVSSPTFVIARTHRRNDSEIPLVHVDAYRLGSPAELDDLDIDFANSISMIEWGRGFTDGLSDSWLDIEIERDHTGETEIREVAIIGNGPRWAHVSPGAFSISERSE
jgi:tRNA threonylcarbamoyladenosine biosynthesis protein TsaE